MDVRLTTYCYRWGVGVAGARACLKSKRTGIDTWIPHHRHTQQLTLHLEHEFWVRIPTPPAGGVV